MRAPATAAVLLFAARAWFATDVTVEMSKDVYGLGEPVVVTITNHSTLPVYMPADPPLDIERSGEGHVAPCGWWPWVVWFEPGESRSYTIEQTDCDTGLPQSWEPGLYVTRVDYQIFEPPYPQHEASVTFCVGPECAPTSSPESSLSPLPWGGVKDRYRLGEIPR